jgi:hypothetical protein
LGAGWSARRRKDSGEFSGLSGSDGSRSKPHTGFDLHLCGTAWDQDRNQPHGNYETAGKPREVRIQWRKKGAVWGAATFGLLGVLIATTQDEDQLRADTGASAAEFAAISVLEGILGGAAIGALIKSEKWETVAVHPALTSRSAGVRIGFSFR